MDAFDIFIPKVSRVQETNENVCISPGPLYHS